MNKGLQDDGVLADVKFESMRRPMTHALYDVVWYTGKGKGGSCSRANGMTTNIRAKDAGEMRSEPGGGGNNTDQSEPKFWVEGEKRITRRNITTHEKKGIKRHVRFHKDNKFIALIKAISFVKWQVKGKLSWKEGEGVASGDFFG